MTNLRAASIAAGLLSLTLFVSACSGGGAGGDGSSGPEGEHHHYVIDSIVIPLDSVQADDLGADLDGDTTIDNQFGNILSALAQAGGAGTLDFQGENDAAVDEGRILLLADLQATDLEAASHAGFAMYRGSNPSPAPCTDPDDPSTCRQHLTGTGTFTVEGGTDVEPLEGDVASNRFQAAGGELPLSFALFGTGAAIDINLVSAGVDIVGITAGSISGASKVFGAIPDAAVQSELIPAVHAAIVSVIEGDCLTPAPPNCNCVASSTGETLMGIFDENADCTVPLAEFQASSLIVTLFRSDLDLDGDTVAESLSFGVGVSAVSGTFTQPQ